MQQQQLQQDEELGEADSFLNLGANERFYAADDQQEEEAVEEDDDDEEASKGKDKDEGVGKDGADDSDSEDSDEESIVFPGPPRTEQHSKLSPLQLFLIQPQSKKVRFLMKYLLLLHPHQLLLGLCLQSAQPSRPPSLWMKAKMLQNESSIFVIHRWLVSMS